MGTDPQNKGLKVRDQGTRKPKGAAFGCAFGDFEFFYSLRIAGSGNSNTYFDDFILFGISQLQDAPLDKNGARKREGKQLYPVELLAASAIWFPLFRARGF